MSSSGHASAAFADLAVQGCLDGDNKQGKRKLDADIPSASQGKPTSGKSPSGIRADNQKDDGQQTDDGQQRLPGQSVCGKNPRIWISDKEWYNYMIGKPDFRLTYSIFRVPKFLKDAKREAYVPQTVSLGPLHHKSEALDLMDHHKGRALGRMMIKSNLKRDIDPENLVFAETATNAIRSAESRIRGAYEESIDCDGRILAWMLCMDGCCILEVLRTLSGHQHDPADKNDLIIGENKLVATNILKDIVMLENQIPLIVLKELLKLEYREGTPVEWVERVLLDLLVAGTSGLVNFSGMDTSSLMMPQDQEFDHVLGFLHKVIIYHSSIVKQDQDEHPCSLKSFIDHFLLRLQDKHEPLNDDYLKSIPTAVELKNVGIKFRPCNGGISGIMFEPKRAIIYLPAISITYGTEVLFRNLIALEMCRPSKPNYVSSYVNLMDDLIDSREDVALLRSRGILTKLIGSDKEVADLFNGLCKDVGIASMANRFTEVKGSVNKHYRDTTRVKFAELVRDHFSSSWKGLATAGAIAILCLTVIQTIFTIISVYKK